MRSKIISGAGALLLCAATVGSALAETSWQQRTPEQDDRILARTVIPDLSPRQRYQSAVQEAGGGLKLNLGSCADLSPGERAACMRDARALYQKDMAAARDILQTGDARSPPSR